MTYTKTVWNPGGAPGVSAPALNKIEQGIYDAHVTADAVAALVDGIDSTRAVYGDNASASTQLATSIDGITKSGFYLSPQITIMGVLDWHHIIHEQSPGAPLYAYQISTPLQVEGKQYWRKQINGVWGNWNSMGSSTAPEWLADLDTLNNGVDGAYSPGSNTTIAGNAIYRWSSLNIPVGVTVSLSSGQWAIILVDGDATINGTLTVSGRGAAGGGTNSSNAGVGGSPGAQGAGSGGGGGGNSSSYQGGGGGGAAGAGPNKFDNPASNAGVGGDGGTYGAAGGVGAQYGAGPFTGGAGGNSNITLVNTFGDTISNFKRNYGAGGGGGSNQFALQAGSGGAGGGVIFVIARNILGTGAIRADGLSGGNASTGDATYGGGGGGGGGGGLVITAANSYSSLTLSANGGSGGLGYQASTNKGGNGGAGGNGVVLKIKR